MVGSIRTSPVEGSYLRKLRKPMIEKRRRERINTSIDQLKAMLTQSRPEIDNDTKLDKAEILELTVNHLTSNPSRLRTSEHTTPRNSDSYNKGFDDCSRETLQYLATRGILDPTSISRLSAHLQHVSRNRSTRQTTIPVPIETVRPQPPPQPQRFCSTPVSHSFPAYPGNASIATTPSYMSTSFASFSHSEESSSGSDVSLLGNILSDEKPWRPW